MISYFPKFAGTPAGISGDSSAATGAWTTGSGSVADSMGVELDQSMIENAASEYLSAVDGCQSKSPPRLGTGRAFLYHTTGRVLRARTADTAGDEVGRR